MRIAENILLILGAAYTAIGGLITIIFASTMDGAGVFLAIPLFFVLLGVIFIIAVLTVRNKRNMVIKKGKKYAAKIYGYKKNTSYKVNGAFPTDTTVHYFDENGIEREVTLPTGASASALMPVGMTIDIYEYRGKYNYDEKSLRNEILPGEKELMDDLPVNPSMVKTIAIDCPNCGASITAAEGYASKCPYCDGYINA